MTDIVDRLYDREYAGPMRHLQDWSDIDALMTEAAVEIAFLRKENEALREVVSESAAALGNGASIAPQCSLEFMQGLPREIALCADRLRQDAAQARADGIEAAAILVEDNIVMNTHEGKILRPRGDGNVEALAYAAAIRSLAEKTPT